MAKYIAKVKFLLAHESRVIDAGNVFETTFPYEVTSNDSFDLVEEEVNEPEKPGKKAKTQ